MAREMDFSMEREGLVKVGDRVTLDESILKTLAGTKYYYTIQYGVAMSNNVSERLKPVNGLLQGTVSRITEKEGLFTVTVACDEG